MDLDLDYSDPGNVKISMEQLTCKVIDEFPEPLPKTAGMPADGHLFTVRNDDDPCRRLLDEKRAVAFHRIVAMLLFLIVRPCRDYRTAVAFLSTRVKEPYKDDWGKLRRLLHYLKRNPLLPLALEANNLGFFHWHVDAFFAVNADMKSHTGGTMSLGRGSIIDTSQK